MRQQRLVLLRPRWFTPADDAVRLSLRFWFRAPAAGSIVATACFAVAWRSG